jgi:hypothetical protein
MYVTEKNLVHKAVFKSAKRYCSSCGYDKDEVDGDIVVSPKRPFTKRFVCKQCMIKRGVRIGEKSKYFT